MAPVASQLSCLPEPLSLPPTLEISLRAPSVSSSSPFPHPANPGPSVAPTSPSSSLTLPSDASVPGFPPLSAVKARGRPRRGRFSSAEGCSAPPVSPSTSGLSLPLPPSVCDSIRASTDSILVPDSSDSLPEVALSGGGLLKASLCDGVSGCAPPLCCHVEAPPIVAAPSSGLPSRADVLSPLMGSGVLVESSSATPLPNRDVGLTANSPLNHGDHDPALDSKACGANAIGPCSSKDTWASVVERKAIGSKSHLKFFPHCSPDGENIILSPPPEVIQQGEDLWGSTLVGYFVGNPVHFNAVNSITRKIWRRFEIQHVAGNESGFFFFRFSSVAMLGKCLNSGPWSIAGHTLFLKRWMPGMVLSREEHKSFPVWISMSGIPVEFWTPLGLCWIASAVGKPIKLDPVTEKLERLGFARVCVELGADAPRPVMIKIRSNGCADLGDDQLREIIIEYQHSAVRSAAPKKNGGSGPPAKADWVPKERASPRPKKEVASPKRSPARGSASPCASSAQKAVSSDNSFCLLQEPVPDEPMESNVLIPPSNRTEAPLDLTHDVSGPIHIIPLSDGYDDGHFSEGAEIQLLPPLAPVPDGPCSGSVRSGDKTLALDLPVSNPGETFGSGACPGKPSSACHVDIPSPVHTPNLSVSNSSAVVIKSRGRKPAQIKKSRGPKKRSPPSVGL